MPVGAVGTENGRPEVSEFSQASKLVNFNAVSCARQSCCRAIKQGWLVSTVRIKHSAMCTPVAPMAVENGVLHFVFFANLTR
jgi:hypothetical protein